MLRHLDATPLFEEWLDHWKRTCGSAAKQDPTLRSQLLLHVDAFQTTAGMGGGDENAAFEALLLSGKVRARGIRVRLRLRLRLRVRVHVRVRVRVRVS